MDGVKMSQIYFLSHSHLTDTYIYIWGVGDGGERLSDRCTYIETVREIDIHTYIHTVIDR